MQFHSTIRGDGGETPPLREPCKRPRDTDPAEGHTVTQPAIRQDDPMTVAVVEEAEPECALRAALVAFQKRSGLSETVCARQTQAEALAGSA